MSDNSTAIENLYRAAGRIEARAEELKNLSKTLPLLDGPKPLLAYLQTVAEELESAAQTIKAEARGIRDAGKAPKILSLSPDPRVHEMHRLLLKTIGMLRDALNNPELFRRHIGAPWAELNRDLSWFCHREGFLMHEVCKRERPAERKKPWWNPQSWR